VANKTDGKTDKENIKQIVNILSIIMIFYPLAYLNL
jgi:hypothetical protein